MDTCNLTACTTYYQLNNNTCPGTCKDSNGNEKYCKCVTDAAQCNACICRKNAAADICDCFLKE